MNDLLRRLDVMVKQSWATDCEVEAAAELRRLQAENEALRSALAQLIVAVRHLKPCPGTLDIAEKVLKGTNPLFPSSSVKESK